MKLTRSINLKYTFQSPGLMQLSQWKPGDYFSHSGYNLVRGQSIFHYDPCKGVHTDLLIFSVIVDNYSRTRNNLYPQGRYILCPISSHIQKYNSNRHR